MTSEIVWTSSSDVKKRTIAGKNLLITIKNNRLFLLNEQATEIWDQLTKIKKCRELDILKVLRSRYPSVSIEQLQIDVRNLLFNLQSRGFVYQDGSSPLSITFSGDEMPDNLGHLSFSEQFHQLAAEQNIPVSGCLEITQRCHLRCLHCYIDHQPISNNKELTTGEICNLLERIAENGCLWLLITGGEPLLRRDFCEIYCQVKELGMIVTVFTSAIDLTERIANIFTEYPPFLIEATLLGATEATFDTVSGVHGSFQRFKKGIYFLRERKIPFHLKMSVMRQNVHEVEAAYQLALEMGAGDFRFDPMIYSDFFHSRKAINLRISVEEAVKLDFFEPYKSRWERIYRTAITKQKTLNFPKNFLFPCRAGKCSFSISADGQLLPCILIRDPAFDIRELSFKDAWKKLNYYTTTAPMNEGNPCLKCSVQTCSKCPAWGYLEKGDLNAKAWFACTLQKEREKLFLHKSNP